MPKVEIVPNTGILTADTDVTANGVSLVQLGTDIETLKTAINDLAIFAQIPSSKAILLTNLLNTIQLDSYGKIIASASLSPNTVNANVMAASSISPVTTQQGAITTVAVLANAITQTAIQEISSSQPITTTLGTSATIPPENTWTFTPINNLVMTPFSIEDDILLTAFVQTAVTNFFLSATGSALPGTPSGTTQVYDLMALQFIEENTNTLIKEFDIDCTVSQLYQSASSVLDDWAVAVNSTTFSYTISHLFSGFDQINLVTQMAAVDMVHWLDTAGPFDLAVTVSDVVVSLTDFQR